MNHCKQCWRMTLCCCHWAQHLQMSGQIDDVRNYDREKLNAQYLHSMGATNKQQLKNQLAFI